jgi:hypothetical protein
MSNHLAIATVTAALQKSLLGVVQRDVPGSTVETVRPLGAAGSNGLPAQGVNIFMYRAAPDPAGAGLDLPTRGAGGEPVQRPCAALALDFLFSFYGDDTLLQSQCLLGSTVRHLHARPLITRAMIESVVGDDTYASLAGSDLAEQVDRIKLTPLPLSLEELSRLWSVFFQSPYVLSLAYRASMVLVEAEAEVQPALPVRDYSFQALPLGRPLVERIVARAGDAVPIAAGAQVRLLGRGLRGEFTEVLVDGQAVAPDGAAGHWLDLTLPAGLRAGVRGLRVRHARLTGQPPQRRPGAASDVAPFVLHPAVARDGPGYDLAVTHAGSMGDPQAVEVRVGVSPAVAPAQQALLELVAEDGAVRSFFAAERDGDSDRLRFTVRALPAGDYLLRVRIDGAESGFEYGPDGRPVAPRVTLT